ncbi:2-hydroxychromene-2-carboxylate isomerase [Crenobacter sp. SG2303]|uniref:2-hydroxychromene-2-carboxylate isomerase n=1 Tax=Crenobacter oryzisoli TaxID=3056844 RepID=A0ABT7XP49_9NEIS|nr:2-hydroxychromene-2-carboxylate isomerase [Crenobacter sp. SG2303]MDN0075572.1 2-hydroxychromene-2-carboxylate isomerase [Crenobacter sp. SG2303]
METALTQAAQSNSEIEFWFEFASTYSYLSVMRIEDAAARHGVTVIWKPFLLGPIFKSLGWDSSPFLQQKAKGEYMWQDMARQCRKYGLPWTRPTTFPRRALLPLRVALIGADTPWAGEYCRRVMSLNFAADRDIDSPEAVGDVLMQLGLPAAQLIDAAQAEPTKLRLREQTSTALDRGVFGAPTFFVRGEMFWGNDRLDDALTLAAQSNRQ